jgi:hypothetical protein
METPSRFDYRADGVEFDKPCPEEYSPDVDVVCDVGPGHVSNVVTVRREDFDGHRSLLLANSVEPFEALAEPNGRWIV